MVDEYDPNQGILTPEDTEILRASMNKGGNFIAEMRKLNAYAQAVFDGDTELVPMVWERIQNSSMRMNQLHHNARRWVDEISKSLPVNYTWHDNSQENWHTVAVNMRLKTNEERETYKRLLQSIAAWVNPA